MKNILILNRRCIKHPESGGAEIYTLKIAEAFSDQGIKVEWFSSCPDGLAAEEEINGIRFLRKGSEISTHFYGLLYALKRKDCLVIDEFNGIGFMTFFMNNSIMLIHQIYGRFWTVELGFLGYMPRLAEKLLLWLYRNKPAVTVSASTRDNLQKFHFRDVTIIHNGLDVDPLENIPDKEPELTVAFLGRLKKTKNPEDAIRAFLLVRETVSKAKLWFIGDGPLYKVLKKKYACVESISFFGFVDNQKKYELLQRAHLLFVPGIREGWGQVVIQANAAGTPAIGYNIEGLRDSIRDRVTGLLVRDFKDMSADAVRLWEDKGRYQDMCCNAMNFAKGFSWKKTGDEFVSFLQGRGLI